MVLNGCCEYCGQSRAIELTDDLPYQPTEEDLNEIATQKCDCPQAKSERRKAETQERIDNFIETEICEECQDFMRAAVEMIRNFQCDLVTIQTNDGWKVTARLNKDHEIVFSCKKSLSKRAVF